MRERMRIMFGAKRVAIFFIVVILGLLWARGTFDYALVNVGLNAQQCGRNGFGATFCGADLTNYNARQQAVQSQYQTTMRTITQQECQADPQLTICTQP